MRVKKVPLQDLELWPDEVVCFTAYTDTRNPVQQRRTYVDGKQLKAENEKLRKERDHLHVEQVHAYGNWEDAHKRVIELEAENANLREELESVGMAAYLYGLYGRGDLRAENDKLREVCADAWMLLVLSGNDDLVAELTIGKNKRVYDAEEITDRMQELGVEMPEWANSASPTR